MKNKIIALILFIGLSINAQSKKNDTINNEELHKQNSKSFHSDLLLSNKSYGKLDNSDFKV